MARKAFDNLLAMSFTGSSDVSKDGPKEVADAVMNIYESIDRHYEKEHKDTEYCRNTFSNLLYVFDVEGLTKPHLIQAVNDRVTEIRNDGLAEIRMTDLQRLE